MAVAWSARIGDFFADPASPGRVVKIIGQRGPEHVLIETVKAADAAVSARAVGKQTTVTRKTLSRFHYVGDDECTFCGYNYDHRRAPSGYHCPVTD